MRFKKIKLMVATFCAVFLLFFSNDFGLIDVEKTAIITAVAIDISEDGKYKVTAQIAVPEATDSNTENQRAQIAGEGYTVGGAIKNIGDTSGWFPQLAFCNLIIVGNSFKDKNLIRILDYFSKSLRIQDSALVIMAEEQAVDLLKLSSPLDNVSSFALQKILLKNAGLNRDVASCDIKRFCSDYYGKSSSCFMPIVSVVSQKSENEKASAEDSGNSGGSNSGGSNSGGGSSEQSGGAKGDTIFSANKTALFLNGIKVGELDKDLTCAFNALKRDFTSNTIEVNDVYEEGKSENFLLNVFAFNTKTNLIVDKTGAKYIVDLSLFVKISDRNSDYSDADYVKNLPLPYAVKVKAEEKLKTAIEDLIRTEIQTGCDILEIKKELYRKHNSFYATFKDNILENLDFTVNVNVSGEK